MTTIKAEMSGTLLELKCKVGDEIKPGQEIAVMESMKMEVPLTAAVAGKVAEIKKAVGDFINEGEALFILQ